MKVLHSLCVAVLSLPAAAQQEEEAFEAKSAQLRETALANLKAGKPLIALDWRRNAAGDFEHKIADAIEKDAKFEPWFGKGLVEAMNATGIAGWVMFFAHHGDVLSLTHGEHHLRRLGIGSTTADLVTFVRSPLPEQLRDVALLDRLVAIDLIARRDDDEAKAARSALAAETTLDAQLRERAAPANFPRRHLDAATLPLPTQGDIYLVCNHESLFDALPLVEIGYFTGMVSTVQVLQYLKAPTLSDFVLGQTESEFLTEIPFEIARRFGNFRLDQTVVALSVPRDGDGGGWIAVSAGKFDAARVAAGVAASKVEGGKAELADGTAKATIDGTQLVVTDLLATAMTPGLAAAPNPEVAARLLNDNPGLRVHVPTGSSLLLAQGRVFGIEGVESIDVTASSGDPVVLHAVLKTKDNASAVAAGKQVKDQLVRMGSSGGMLLRAALALDDDPRAVAVDGNEVRVHLEVPRSQLLTPAMVRDRLIEESVR